jgi:hypothetical protein
MGVLIAHWIFRIFYVGRKYPGVSIAEDVFILLFTIPSAASAGYVVILLPIGMSLLISISFFVWSGEWPHDEHLSSMNNIIFTEWPNSIEKLGNFLLIVTSWVVPAFMVSWFRRRKRNGSIRNDL